ncbi:MAG TPA: trypsin-like peptidase domain-containing protein [Burkholderiaceae bacterium]|nr:trypsin-like peptidase domain-containing protein [Burkholderiaceae bacterium]
MEAAAKGVSIKPPLYVVRVTGVAADGAPVSGTGFIVGEGGHVATCRHVVFVKGAKDAVGKLCVKLPYPAERPYAYRVMAESADDLALLEPVVPLDFKVPEAMLHDDWTRDTQVGDAITAWGYSAAEHYTQAQRFNGCISGLAGAHGRIGLAMDLNPGDSGGPVLDAQRRVVAVVQATDAKRDGQAMGIPVSLLRAMLQRAGLLAAHSTEAAFGAPRLPDHSLVGRARLLEETKDAIRDGRHVVLCFKPGVGKSAVATALAHQLRPDFGGGVLWASLNVAPNVLSQLRKWAGEDLKLKADEIEQLDRLAGSEAEQIERWARALARHVGDRRMLIVIDDAWELEPAKALLLDAPNCAYLVTTREPAKVAAMLGPRFDVRVVDELEMQDGVALLRELAEQAVDWYPEEAKNVFTAVGGLPQGLLLLGNLLRAAQRTGRRSRIEEAYAKIRNEPADPLRPLHAAIRLSYDHLPGDDARRALRALSIFRPKPDVFTEAAALAVLEQPRRVLDDLEDAGLIESAPRARPLAGEDPPYTMHRTIDDFACAELAAFEPGLATELHRRAANHYTRWLEAYERGDAGPASYGTQYRYENAAWQDAMDEFLYHLARAGDPILGIRSFGRIYFSTFWWWGCFAEFPFCTKLLKQAAGKRLSDEARGALELLGAFDAAYPKEGRADRRGDWQQVERSLTELRRRGGLDDDALVAADPGVRHTRALTSIFLAEAHRFGAADEVRAEALYRDALDLLPEGDWSRPWVHYHLADMHCEAGRADAAAQHAAAALALAQADDIALKDRDNEVIANIWRVEAALAAAREGDDVAPLALACERAVLHAYAFQAIPEPPDDYTELFYRQLVGRVTALLAGLHARASDKAIACCDALREAWASYRRLAEVDGPALDRAALDALLRPGSTDALGAYLFPPPPPAAVKHVKGSRYANQAIMVFNEKMAVA